MSKPGKVPGPVRVMPKHGEPGHKRHDTACAGCAFDNGYHVVIDECTRFTKEDCKWLDEYMKRHSDR